MWYKNTMTNSRDESQILSVVKKKNNDNERISDSLQQMEQHIPQNNC